MTPPGLFITGTDTEVGKTWVSASLVAEMAARGDRVGAIKPISTSGVVQDDGSLASPDAITLRQALKIQAPLARISPLVLPGDVAPSVALRMAGSTVGQKEIVEITRAAIAWWQERADVIVVEGVGGLLCPLACGTSLADLAVAIDFPLLIVARLGLGTLNHTVLTVEAAKRRGLRIAGVVLNSVQPSSPSLAAETNPQELASLLPDVPILATIPFQPSHASLSQILSVVDWKALAKPPRLNP